MFIEQRGQVTFDRNLTLFNSTFLQGTEMKLLLVAAAIASAAMAAPAANSANGDQMLVEAMDFMARASSTSEVLTLNLTNLLILLVLKALIFGFGLFSFGNAGAAAGAASLNARQVSGFRLLRDDVDGQA